MEEYRGKYWSGWEMGGKDWQMTLKQIKEYGKGKGGI